MTTLELGYIGHREGCSLPALGIDVAFNEKVGIVDPDVFVCLAAQPDNWVPTTTESATFLRDFCVLVETVPNPPPLAAAEPEPALVAAEPLAAAQPKPDSAARARTRSVAFDPEVRSSPEDGAADAADKAGV